MCQIMNKLLINNIDVYPMFYTLINMVYKYRAYQTINVYIVSTRN